jgi:hypothetical protein
MTRRKRIETLKGVWHKIFNFRFFSWISVPQVFQWGRFSKICGEIREWMFITGDKNKDAMEGGAAKDRRKLKGTNRLYLRPSTSNTAANGVIGTAMKSCIHKHPTHLDQRSPRPPEQNNAVLVWSSFGGLRSLWSGCLRCLCAFS